MALGAQQGSILWLVPREVVLLVTVGIAVAVPVSFALTRCVASMLYHIPPTDRMALGGVTLLMTAVALVAGYLPAPGNQDRSDGGTAL